MKYAQCYLITLFLLVLSLTASSAEAQVTLNNLPTWTRNTRFATSTISQVRHPSLSLNGF